MKLPTHTDTRRNERIAFHNPLRFLYRLDFEYPQAPDSSSKGPAARRRPFSRRPCLFFKEALSIYAMSRPSYFNLFLVLGVFHQLLQSSLLLLRYCLHRSVVSAITWFFWRQVPGAGAFKRFLDE